MHILPTSCCIHGKNIWFLTWTWSDTAHDDLRCFPLTSPTSMLRWRVAAGSDPGSVALTTGARAFLPEGPLWPVTIHCRGTDFVATHAICTQFPLHILREQFQFSRSFRALSPGQGFPWQLRDSVSDPAQWRPPLAGRGLLHCLSLFCDPTPQDTLQGPHSVHSEKPPWTGKKNGKTLSMIFGQFW